MNKAKQVIVMRKDLNMRKGKMVAQGAHASMAAILKLGSMQREHSDLNGHLTNINLHIPLFRSPFDMDKGINHAAAIEWLEGAFTKVCVSVNSEQELLDLCSAASEAGMIHSLIRDNGLTEFGGVPTVTCAAFGPAYSDEVDKITGHLPLL